MTSNFKSYNLKSVRNICSIALIIFFTKAAMAQITGPASVCQNSSEYYTFDNGVVYVPGAWIVTGGTLVSSTTSGTLYSAVVQWTTLGAGSLQFRARPNTSTLATLNVTTAIVPSAPSAPNTSLCAKGTILATAGANANTVKWYDAGGNFLTQGTTSPLTTLTTTYTIKSFNSTTGCESTASSTVTVTIITAPPAPTFINNPVCGSGTITAIPGNTAQTVKWYSSLTNGTLLATSTTSPNTTSTTTYYTTSLRTSTGCESDPRTAVTVTVNPLPAAPTVTGNTRFGAGTVTLTASGGTSFQWYNASNVSQGTGTTFSPSNNLAIGDVLSNVYNVKAISNNCYSTATPITLKAFTNPVVAASSPQIALNASTTLDAGAGYSSYSWANAATPATVLATTQTYSTNAKGTYQVTVSKEGASTVASFTVGGQFDGLNKNYVVTNMILVDNITDPNTIESLPVSSNAQTVQYVDGLGRPIQSVSTQASPTLKDIVQPVAYDGFGREVVKYLPFTNGASGRYKDNMIDPATGNYLNAALSFYNTSGDKIADDVPYAKTILESSPLNRVLEQGAPGSAWQPDAVNSYTSTDRTIKKAYELNLANEVLAWSYTNASAAYPFGKVNAGTAATPIYYAANQLSKIRTKDEQMNEVIEFTDKSGHVVLKQVQAGPSLYASTYYIYDDLGQSVCVIPPEATARLATEYYHTAATDATKESFLMKWAFRYRYDNRRRMILKEVPGADSVRMVYDLRDRLVLTQDGNQRTQNKWGYTKYDALNRPVMTGIYTHTSNLTQPQMSALISTTNLVEAYNGVAATHGYTNNVWPTTNLTVLSVSYYDTYDFKTLVTGLNYVNNDLAGQRTDEFLYVKGKPTGAKTNIIGTTNYLYSVTYYDDKYRAVQSITQNHKGGFDRLTSKFDFAGRALEAKAIHNNGTTTQTTKRRFDYDHAGRVIRTWHTLNSQPEVLLAQNEYNEIGQLVDKKLHSTDGITFKQSVDYRYNIRGWLTSMNDATLTNNGTTNDDTGDLFGMNLGYNNDLGVGNTALYNGNISGITWSNSLGLSTVKQSAYVYTYDAMNRIQSSTFKEKAAAWTAPVNAALAETGYQYDLNGNITALQRNDRRASGWMDNLVYNYTGSGNQLKNVKDNGDANAGFVDGNPSTTVDDYAYDANGNMVTDKNKSLTAANAIQYNHLNLPTIVTKSTGEYVKYTYNAGGQKLKQEVFNASGVVTKTTDYIGEYIYENNVLQFVNHEEGRIVTTGASPEYQYHLKDHLGNVRLTFTSKVELVAETATLEDANSTTEQSQFLRFVNAKRVKATILDKTNGASIGYAERLNGSANEKYGLAKSISVMPGDVVNIEVYAKYIDPNSANWTGALSTLMSQITANTTGVVFTDATGYANSTTSFNASYPGLLGTKTDNGAPKAYLNWLIFDRNYVSLTGGFKQITTAGKEAGTDVAHELVNSPTINITDAGYMYIWLSNENATPVEVYFDDFKVTQTKSPVVATNDYYAFGLTFNSYSRENSIANDFKYNGKEEQTELGIGWLDYGARMYQPELGRFFTLDRFASKYFDTSPYSYASNNPALYVDINGDSVWTTHKSTVDKNNNTTITHTVNVTGKVLKNGTGSTSASSLATGLNARLNAQSSTVVTKDANGNTVTVITKIKANFTAAGSMSDVSKSDHLVVMVDGVQGKGAPQLGGGDAVGLAGAPGKIAYVEGPSSDVIGTAFHETGHMLGLPDAEVNSSSDPMSYTGRGSNFSPGQMETILDNAPRGNQGSNFGIMKDYFPGVSRGAFDLSSNTRPFQIAPDQRAKIPLPLVNPNR